MQDYKINAQLLNTLLNYLASKPYGEVYRIIDELQKLEAATGDSAELATLA